MWPFSRKLASVAEDDHVWLSGRAKLRGLAREVRKAVDLSTDVLIVAHFTDTAEALLGALAEEGVTPSRPTGAVTPAQFLSRAHTDPTVVLSAQLSAPPQLGPQASGTPAAARPDAPLILLLCAERHPLRDRDDRVANFAAALGPPGTVALRFHLSLDDPLLALFAGGFTRDMLVRLGMTESEALKNAMVTQSIRRAQDKVSTRRPMDREARSAAEWCQRAGLAPGE